MSLIDDLISRGLFPSTGRSAIPSPGMLSMAGFPGGVPASPAVAMPSAADDYEIEPDLVTGGVTMRKKQRFAAPTYDQGARPPALSSLRASAGITAPTAPFSGGAGADIPFTSPSAPDVPPGGPVPLPRPRPAAPPMSLASPEAAETGDRTIPSKATLAEGEIPAEPSILDKLTTALGNNSQTLIALGAGFAGAPNAGQGISRALAGALPAQQADLKRQLLLGNQQATFQALVQAGVPRQQAMAALQNPKLLEALTSRYMIDPKLEIKTVKDAIGGERLVGVDPYTGKVSNVEGGSDAGAAPPGIFAPGVTQENPELKGDEYLAQFSPDVQAMAKAYANGDVMPTGNPRQQGLQTFAKKVAIRWGNDTGNPVSDSTYSAKRTMQTSLAGSGPSSIGGILSNGRSAFQHLANLGDKFVDLGNFSGPAIPGGGYVGQAANVVGNTLAPTPKTLGKLTAVRDNALKYGQESTKFYAGTGGGVHERTEALHAVGGGKTTAEEQASFLQTEKELMLERLAEKERQVASVMGENWLAQHPIRDSALQANLDKIDKQIAVLRGEAPVSRETSAAASAAQRRTSTGVPWSIVGTP